MPVKVEVKAQNDPIVKGKRELTAQNVLQKFGNELPELKLLAFFDDEDPDYLRQNLGPANRGFYGPIKTSTPWPPRMADRIFVFDESLSSRLKQVFDHG